MTAQASTKASTILSIRGRAPRRHAVDDTSGSGYRQNMSDLPVILARIEEIERIRAALDHERSELLIAQRVLERLSPPPAPPPAPPHLIEPPAPEAEAIS